MPRRTTRDVRADEVTTGMRVTSHGPITAHRGAETITRVRPSHEHGQDVIELYGTKPGAWMLPRDETVRVVSE